MNEAVCAFFSGKETTVSGNQPNTKAFTGPNTNTCSQISFALWAPGLHSEGRRVAVAFPNDLSSSTRPGLLTFSRSKFKLTERLRIERNGSWRVQLRKRHKVRSGHPQKIRLAQPLRSISVR